MKVRCVTNRPTPALMEYLGYDPAQECVFDNVTPGTLYAVLGLRIMGHESAYGPGATIEFKDDHGIWGLAPLCLFTIVDPRPSGLWIACNQRMNELSLWPRSFSERPYYHSDLLDGVPEVVEDFHRVCKAIEEEFTEEYDSSSRSA